MCTRATCTHGCGFVCACTCLCNIHSGPAVMDGVLCCSSGAISQPESRGGPPACDAPRWRLKARTHAGRCVHAHVRVAYMLWFMHVSTQPCVQLKICFPLLLRQHVALKQFQILGASFPPPHDSRRCELVIRFPFGQPGLHQQPHSN